MSKIVESLDYDDTFDQSINTTDSNSSTVFTNETSVNNTEIPQEFTEMGPNSLNCIIVYTFLFIIASTGNFSVFFTVLNELRRKSSRIALLILHLSIADLLVTFGVIPLEIIWRITVQWYGGNILCKICKFFSAFGLYLSSMVLICISLDRYFAIIHPLSVSNAHRRGRFMLSSAWISAIICSVPQSIIFHVQQHPMYESFHQCVTIGFFSTPEQEMIYNILSVIFMYFLPLVIIFFTYGMILCKISRKSRQGTRKELSETSGRILLRRNEALNHMERAKSRTLRLTFVIVMVFLFCWTPYVVITLWYMFDRESAKQVDTKIQDALFIMAVANSCLNPLVYGSYTRECRDSVTNCFGQTACHRNRQRLVREGSLRQSHRHVRNASRRSTNSYRLGMSSLPPTPPAQYNQQNQYFPHSPNGIQNRPTNRSVKLKVPDRSPNGSSSPKLVVEYSTSGVVLSEPVVRNGKRQSTKNINCGEQATTQIPLTHYNCFHFEGKNFSSNAEEPSKEGTNNVTTFDNQNNSIIISESKLLDT